MKMILLNKLPNLTKIYSGCINQKQFIKYFSLTSVKNQTKQLKTVKLSYISYESTNTKTSPSPAPLLVLHGLFGSKQNWKSLCKAIQQKTNPSRKVIAIDARNHGESPHTTEHSYEHIAEDIHELLKQEQIERVSVLGHSMGGRAMMYLALKYPNLIEKAIIVDISPVKSSPDLISMLPIFDAMKSVKIPKDITMIEARKLADKYLSIAINEQSVRDFLITNLIKTTNGEYNWRVNVETLKVNFLPHVAHFPKVDNLQYRGPTLFIGGGNSDYISESDLPGIKGYFPEANLHIIPDSGHWVHSEKPAEFLKIVLDFLNENQ